MRGTSDNVDLDIFEELLGMLDKNNELVKAFRMARNRFENEDLDEFKLVLISSQSSSGRPNHITPSNEVVAFIVSDDTNTGGFRDTVVNSKQEGLKRIYETDLHFMQLQYPLLFPWGTEGYHKRLTPHLVVRLWQHYIVDQFAAIEQYRLDWVLTHQTTIRADFYNSVRDALSKGGHDPMHVGKAVILPASFTGSQRYMSQYFKDSLAICRAIVMHVIKFQKHGLPHVHMLIWLSPENRPNSIEKVDQLVSAEIPYKNSDPIAYEAVKNYMMHGPCGLIVIPILTIVVFLFIGGITLCHINLEICNSSRSLKYLFKYCLKGHDTATMLLKKKSNKSGNEQTARSVKNLDEVKNFLDGGYSSADLEDVCNNATSKKSKVEAWFVANSEFPQAQNFTCKGALSFTQLRTIDGTTYDRFKEACGALGLLNNDKQWHDALEENAFSAMPTQIQAMFVNILANCSMSDPLALWEKHWPALSDDVLYIRRKIYDNIHLTLSEYEIQNYDLAEIEKLLNDVGSGIAATLLPGGRTAHSRFKIPLKLDQSSIAGIKHVVFGGDFRQILPVLPKVGRAEIVNASFNKSRLWKSCKVFLLSQNMRLHSGNSEARNKVIADFSKCQLEIRDGRVECIDTHRADIETEFVVPDEYVVKSPLKSPIKP
ncbi:uncharacterized protein LOC141674238 [Apium graveolens]|uniref:uncharacterized protein LOC141674238 n=1 Tax=Apium graveolens TaxID=4045 RepID=UPI003D7BBFD0